LGQDQDAGSVVDAAGSRRLINSANAAAITAVMTPSRSYPALPGPGTVR
jgi:hypothetical protein